MVIRQIYRLAILILIFGVGLSGVVAGGVAAWLHNKGGLDAVLTRYLQERFPSVTIGIEEIDWQIDAHRQALVLSGNQVRLITGEQALNIPSIDLVFTHSSLVKQMPTAIVIDTDRLEVTYSDIGWQFSDALHCEADTASDTDLTGQNLLNRIGTIWQMGCKSCRCVPIRPSAGIKKTGKFWIIMICYLSPHRKAEYLPMAMFFNSASLANRLASRCGCSTANLCSGQFIFQMDGFHPQAGRFRNRCPCESFNRVCRYISHSPRQNICTAFRGAG